MNANTETAEKRIVEQLQFGAKTAKRVGWEAWEFTVAGPLRVEVTNASYGAEKDDHRYYVTIAERDGVPVPAECQCPADKYNDEYDCKHKVALATVGGPTVLEAAAAFSTDPDPTLRTDGGTTIDAAQTPERPDDCDCAPFLGELPCWPCYRAGFETPNPEAEGDQ